MTELLDAALAYAAAGYEVFPLVGKVPAIRSAHPEGDPLHGKCKGGCGRDGHGCLDATTDPPRIEAWWSQRPAANIGARVPESLMVLDIDPRHNGHLRLADHEERNAALPYTRTSISGRGDGGRHLWWIHPGGRPSSVRLGEGLDLKTHAGYVVLPPSLHPDTGQPYRWLEPLGEVAVLPDWLRQMLLPVVPPTVTYLGRLNAGGETVADALSWADILQPEGWRCLDHDPDGDGARWRHPTATAPISATVRHGCLFVYSTNTPFRTTEAGAPAGYTKLRAVATLHHRGDCKAAHRALADRRGT